MEWVDSHTFRIQATATACSHIVTLLRVYWSVDVDLVFSSAIIGANEALTHSCSRCSDDDNDHGAARRLQRPFRVQCVREWVSGMHTEKKERMNGCDRFATAVCRFGRFGRELKCVAHQHRRTANRNLIESMQSVFFFFFYFVSLHSHQFCLLTMHDDFGCWCIWYRSLIAMQLFCSVSENSKFRKRRCRIEVRRSLYSRDTSPHWNQARATHRKAADLCAIFGNRPAAATLAGRKQFTLTQLHRVLWLRVGNRFDVFRWRNANLRSFTRNSSSTTFDRSQITEWKRFHWPSHFRITRTKDLWIVWTRRIELPCDDWIIYWIELAFTEVGRMKSLRLDSVCDGRESDGKNQSKNEKSTTWYKSVYETVSWHR